MTWLGDAVNGGWSLNHDLTTSLGLSHLIFLKSILHLQRYQRKGAPSYAHPRHLKVLKRFVFIQYQYGCGMQSMGACSLNHDTTTSYRLGHPPFFLKFMPTCTCNTAIRMHPYVHPQHLKVLNTFYTSNMDVGCSQWGFAASTMTPQHHSDLAMPQFS
jgi:hypothetical protein